MLNDGELALRGNIQDVSGRIGGTQGMDRGYFVAPVEGSGGPEGLGSFRKALGALWGRFGGHWLAVEGGPLEALGRTDREPKAHCGRQLQRNQWF